MMIDRGMRDECDEKRRYILIDSLENLRADLLRIW
jgi:hypothetical protein